MNDEGWLAAGGEAGQLIRQIDWSTNSLGPPETWPEALRALVSVLLGSNQPMFLAWGPERRMIYNDDYAEIMQDRHPAAMGQPFDVVWADILELVGPIMDRGYAGEPIYSDELELWMLRGGERVETHFAFSYSPVRTVSGEVGGVFCTCIETTGRIIAERARSQLEREHKASAEMVSLALDSGAVIGAWVWHIQADIVQGDARLAEVFGASVEATAQGLPLHVFLDAIHPDDRARVRSEIETVLSSPGPFRSEYRVRTPSAGYRWIYASGRVKVDEEGRADRFPGVLVDIEALRRAQDELRDTIQQRTLLAHELEHRIKNVLAMVSAIAHQTFRAPATLENAADLFAQRIRALARAQDILTRTSWMAAGLGEVVNEVIPAGLTERIAADGPPINLPAKTALALALALHELCTNAVKYGALSSEGGFVNVSWSVDTDGDGGRRFRFLWVERGGPPVSAPTRRGFGTRLMTSALSSEFRGTAEIDYLSEGVRFTLTAPYPFLEPGA